jgi:hypothetical protein
MSEIHSFAAMLWAGAERLSLPSANRRAQLDPSAGPELTRHASEWRPARA